MSQTSPHRVRAVTTLLMLCLGAALWLQGDADEAPPPAPAATSAVPQPIWGVEDPLTRLLPIDSYGGPRGGPLSLTGARNEVADRQLILLAGPQPWTGVRVAFSDLRGPRGAVVPRALLHWRPVGSIRTTAPYYQTRYVGLWPDPLLPPAPFDVPAHGRASVWVDLHVPVGTPAGSYTGVLTLSSRSAAPLSVPLSLHVWGFTIPRQCHLMTSFGTQGSGSQKLDPKALEENMLAHRITPINSVGHPDRIPVPGKPTRWDWTQYDKNVEHELSEGMTSLYAWLPDPRDEWAAAWQTHLKAKGWLPLAYTYLFDEPYPQQYPQINAELGQVRHVAPLLPNLVTTPGYPDAVTTVDIWCPSMRDFDTAQSARVQARGQASWWYTAYAIVHPKINVWTDYPALDDRVWVWMTWKYHLDGILYWTVCSWGNSPDPLQETTVFRAPGAANGDGELIYPGPDGRPLDSIRWEALRDGMQDYEVFCLLEAGARELTAAHKSPALAAQAQALLGIDPGVVTSYAQYNADPHALLTAREQMSQTLEKIVNALGHEPSITTHPRLHPEIPRLQYQAWKAAQVKPH